MPLSLTQTVPPAAEPVTLDRLKAHLRVDFADDDALIAALGVAARQHVEDATGLQLVAATWLLCLDSFPCVGGGGTAEVPPGAGFAAAASVAGVYLPRPPALSVVSLAYDDSAGNPRTLDPSLYRLAAHGRPARLTPAWGHIWPVTRCQTEAVRITYAAGYGPPSAVPEPLNAAILLIAGHLYEHREEGSEVSVTSLPFGVPALLNPYVVHWEY